ncbi:serine protease family s09x [Stylonychia lemnae]|uniref:Serine protease family s09x n=1 Tax=Stylonychia lemnae TaxID=5949 RepID=A0A078AHE9_STYLE|nr:serine protease family s09x [Stylonychia lemnae]|eukprot:CDW81715.1 serine protease family s09x [Stylonychia lemnae]
MPVQFPRENGHGFRTPRERNMPYIEINTKTDDNVTLRGGYSDSEGHPVEDGIKLDAKAIVEFVKQKEDIDQDQVYLLGRSLGGAVGIYAATLYPKYFRGLIFENTFTSMGAMVDHLFKFFGFFKYLILRNKWNSIDLVSSIKAPILFITGDKDELVPYQMTLQLHDNSKDSVLKKIFIVKDGTHNDSWYVGGKSYLEELNDFLNEAQAFDYHKL